MTATHNALLGALSRHAHFSEFSDYLNVGGNIMTPLQRRNLALQNLLGNTGTFSDTAGMLQLPGNTLPVGAGTGITTGVGTVYKTGVQRTGNVVYSNILLDLTGLAAIATDLDIIGVGALPAHLGQITAAVNGTPLAGLMTCLEVPAGASADIDLYFATEATGILDGGVAALTETALITAGGAWTLALTKAFADPVALADKYLYLTNGAAANAGTYTAGKFLIEVYGYG